MKAQRSTQAQGPQRGQEEQYADWYRSGEEADAKEFSEWLDTPEGHEWINTQAETEDEREGMSSWNHDGFSPEPRYAH
jgi:hypothetical protein